MSEEPPSWTTSPPHPEADPEVPAAERPPAPEVAGMSFEHALAELEKIVQDLERGQLDLEAAIQAYERGTALKEHCDRKLKEAKLRVDRITLGPDGSARSEPMDPA
ncbi:MAG TPA: exodeoxyribonuclease VII small subunit [Geminicoccaceae bacterium]|nr:exodeoxyribonuclease VII small subunit [Geminicoccaceae bacterium]